MALTADQASPDNLLNSIKDWLNVNVIVPYNQKVVGTSFPSSMAIKVATPDDPDIYAKVPCIALEPNVTDVGSPIATGLADGLVWRFKRVYMCIYPAVTQDGKPALRSAMWLQGLFDYALGTALTMPLYDYSQSPPLLADFAYIEDPKIITPKGKIDPSLGLERHRFDYQVTLKYSQITING